MRSPIQPSKCWVFNTGNESLSDRRVTRARWAFYVYVIQIFAAFSVALPEGLEGRCVRGDEWEGAKGCASGGCFCF